MEFREWMEHRYRQPVVVVLAAPDVESICRRGGLDLVQLLRPFTRYRGTLYARVGDRGDAVSVVNFGVKLVRPECVREVSTGLLLKHFHRMLREYGPVELAYGEQLDTALSAVVGDGAPSTWVRLEAQLASILLERARGMWQTAFVRDLAHLIRCSHFDTLDHPVGCLFAVSTRTDGGANGIVNAFRHMQQRLQEIRRDMPGMDDELHYYYLLVHDVSHGPPLEETRNLLAHVQTVYGTPNCALLKINSVVNPEDWKNVDPAPWVEASQAFYDVPSAVADAAANGDEVAAGAGLDMFPRVHTFFGKWPSGANKVTGSTLSPENLSDIRSVMNYYLSQALFTHMERRLRSLSQSIKAKRSTAFDKVAAWFRNKDEVKVKSECWVVPRDGSMIKYLAGSLEIQMRRAADLSLFMGDFSSAVSYYKMCRDELLATVSNREFNKPLIAACQEGIGVCHFFMGRLGLPSLTPWVTGGTLGSSKGHHECRMETAMVDYFKWNLHPYALRAAIVLVEYCRTRTPPSTDRSVAVLQYVLRSGLALSSAAGASGAGAVGSSSSKSKLFVGVVHECVASSLLFMNAPYAAGMSVPLTMPGKPLIATRVRRYAKHLVTAGRAYAEDGLLEMALRCYLRALTVYRKCGAREAWLGIFDHIIASTGHLYWELQKPVKAISISAAALTLGTPMYANATSGYSNLEAFWARKRQLLHSLGYTICPHMVLPRVEPKSFAIRGDLNSSDDITEQETLMLGEQGEVEWMSLEDRLRSYYVAHTNLTVKRHQCKTFTERSALDRSTWVVEMALGEPLTVSVTLTNPVSGPITAEKICLLYVAKASTELLWKSSSVQTLRLEAHESARVSLQFSPKDEGEFVIVGYCWSILGVDGYYYFTTKEVQASCPETVFEYALDHPAPDVASPDNIQVRVLPAQGWLSTAWVPPLPTVLRDGEYLRTTLVVTNRSTVRSVSKIALQRSPANAHLLWFAGFSLDENLDSQLPLALSQSLGPGESVTLDVTIRAQHDGSGVHRCTNNIPLLIGYCPEVAPEKWSHAVRLHRVLRRFSTRPSVYITSSILPPTNRDFATVVTAKVSNAASGPRESPVRIARVATLHHPRWRVTPVTPETLLADRAVGCLLMPSASIGVPLSVVRLPAHAAVASETPYGLVDSVCLRVEDTVAGAAKREALLAAVGTELSTLGMTLYFMQRAHRGAGRVGHRLAEHEEMAMYVDKASEVIKAAEEAAMRKRQAMLDFFGGPTDVHPPVCVVASWVVEDDGQTHHGQAFHFADVVGFIPHLEAPGVLAAPGAALQTTGPVPPPMAECGSDSLVIAGGDSGSVRGDPTGSQWQEYLSQCMCRLRTPLNRHGAILYHVQVPQSVENTSALPRAALTPMTVSCFSIASVPVAVEVCAPPMGGTNAAAGSRKCGIPVAFVGKTRTAFVLLPSERHDVALTAHVFTPGLVNCNLVTVRVMPLCISSALTNGMSLVPLLQKHATLPPSASSIWRHVSAGGVPMQSDKEVHGIPSPAGPLADLASPSSPKVHVSPPRWSLHARLLDGARPELARAIVVLGRGVAAVTRVVFHSFPVAHAADASAVETADVVREFQAGYNALQVSRGHSSDCGGVAALAGGLRATRSGPGTTLNLHSLLPADPVAGPALLTYRPRATRFPRTPSIAKATTAATTAACCEDLVVETLSEDEEVAIPEVVVGSSADVVDGHHVASSFMDVMETSLPHSQSTDVVTGSTCPASPVVEGDGEGGITVVTKFLQNCSTGSVEDVNLSVDMMDDGVVALITGTVVGSGANPPPVRSGSDAGGGEVSVGGKEPVARSVVSRREDLVESGGGAVTGRSADRSVCPP